VNFGHGLSVPLDLRNLTTLDHLIQDALAVVRQFCRCYDHAIKILINSKATRHLRSPLIDPTRSA